MHWYLKVSDLSASSCFVPSIIYSIWICTMKPSKPPIFSPGSISTFALGNMPGKHEFFSYPLAFSVMYFYNWYDSSSPAPGLQTAAWTLVKDGGSVGWGLGKWVSLETISSGKAVFTSSNGLFPAIPHKTIQQLQHKAFTHIRNYCLHGNGKSPSSPGKHEPCKISHYIVI